MPYDESNIQRMLHNQLERILTYPAQVENEFSDTAKNLICHLLEPDVTRRANIEQSINHEWLNTVGRPESAVGGGDILQTEDEVTPLRYEGTDENLVPCEGIGPPTLSKQTCIGATKTVRNVTDYQIQQQQQNCHKSSQPQQQQFRQQHTNGGRLSDITNKMGTVLLNPREDNSQRISSPRH